MDSLQIITIPAEPLQPTSRSVPALFTNAGSDAARRFMECFTSNIRNRHTQAAYARGTARFARRCDAHHLALTELTPVIVAAYIAELDLATVLDDKYRATQEPMTEPSMESPFLVDGWDIK